MESGHEAPRCRHTCLDARRVSAVLCRRQGICILLTSLSGGTRGIVELEILRLIEQALSGRIAIRKLFDLIVGTRFATFQNNS